jgi:hypothetical protein
MPSRCGHGHGVVDERELFYVHPHVGKRLPVRVSNDTAARDLVGVPRRRKAAWWSCHASAYHSPDHPLRRPPASAAQLRISKQRLRWEVVLQARLTEVTAQRDRWEQRFDQLKLPPVNTGERRSWWRRLAG